MLSDRLLYFLAVGVLAVGVTDRYADQGRAWVQCAVNEVKHASHDMAGQMAFSVGGGPARVVREELIQARVQARVDRAEARVDQVEAKIDCRNAEATARANLAMARLNARMDRLRTQQLMK